QMSRIRPRNTSPERLLREELWHRGCRYRLHARTPCGKPDIVFPRRRVAVFIDGCFWHGCPDHYVRPRTRNAFWAAKLRGNVERDMRQTAELEGLGWRACRLWEHEVFQDVPRAASTVVEALNAPEWRPTLSWRVVEVEALDGPGDLERRYLRELRNCMEPRVVVQKRSTRKWSRRAQ